MEISIEFLSTSLTTKLETLVIGKTDSPPATNWIGLQSKDRFSNCKALTKARVYNLSGEIS